MNSSSARTIIDFLTLSNNKTLPSEPNTPSTSCSENSAESRSRSASPVFEGDLQVYDEWTEYRFNHGSVYTRLPFTTNSERHALVSRVLTEGFSDFDAYFVNVYPGLLPKMGTGSHMADIDEDMLQFDLLLDILESENEAAPWFRFVFQSGLLLTKQSVSTEEEVILLANEIYHNRLLNTDQYKLVTIDKVKMVGEILQLIVKNNTWKNYKTRYGLIATPHQLSKETSAHLIAHSLYRGVCYKASEYLAITQDCAALSHLLMRKILPKGWIHMDFDEGTVYLPSPVKSANDYYMLAKYVFLQGCTQPNQHIVFTKKETEGDFIRELVAIAVRKGHKEAARWQEKLNKRPTLPSPPEEKSDASDLENVPTSGTMKMCPIL